MDLNETFESYDDEYLKFDRVENKLSQRPDLHAFLLLDSIMPGNRDMVCASEHDEFFLDIDCSEFSRRATAEQIRELVRCGVRYDASLDSLAMFA